MQPDLWQTPTRRTQLFWKVQALSRVRNFKSHQIKVNPWHPSRVWSRAWHNFGTQAVTQSDETLAWLWYPSLHPVCTRSVTWHTQDELVTNIWRAKNKNRLAIPEVPGNCWAHYEVLGAGAGCGGLRIVLLVFFYIEIYFYLLVRIGIRTSAVCVGHHRSAAMVHWGTARTDLVKVHATVC